MHRLHHWGIKLTRFDTRIGSGEFRCDNPQILWELDQQRCQYPGARLLRIPKGIKIYSAGGSVVI
jgi:hypothetical protein